MLGIFLEIALVESPEAGIFLGVPADQWGVLFWGRSTLKRISNPTKNAVGEAFPIRELRNRSKHPLVAGQAERSSSPRACWIRPTPRCWPEPKTPAQIAD